MPLDALLRLQFDAREVPGKEVLHASVKNIGVSARVRDGTGTVRAYNPATDTFEVRPSSVDPRPSRLELTRGCAPHT